MEQKPVKREIRLEKVCEKQDTFAQPKTMHAVETFCAQSERTPGPLEIFASALLEEPERWDGMG